MLEGLSKYVPKFPFPSYLTVPNIPHIHSLIQPIFTSIAQSFLQGAASLKQGAIVCVAGLVALVTAVIAVVAALCIFPFAMTWHILLEGSKLVIKSFNVIQIFTKDIYNVVYSDLSEPFNFRLS